MHPVAGAGSAARVAATRVAGCRGAVVAGDVAVAVEDTTRASAVLTLAPGVSAAAGYSRVSL